MAKIDNIHNRIRLYLSKSRSGYFNPEEIDEAIFIASKDLFHEMKKAYEGSQSISDHLSVFKSDPTTLTLDGSGKSSKPTGYQHVTSLTSGLTSSDVDVVDEAFRADRLNDPICPPTEEYPICVIYNTYLQFNPITISNVEITFLKEPVAPRWGYIITDGVPVYQETGGLTGDTIDIEWDEDTLNEIEVRTLSVLGINMREDNIVQYGEAKAQQ